MTEKCRISRKTENLTGKKNIALLLQSILQENYIFKNTETTVLY